MVTTGTVIIASKHFVLMSLIAQKVLGILIKTTVNFYSLTLNVRRINKLQLIFSIINQFRD